MENIPNCPQCDSDLAYTDGVLYICPMCAHEWSPAEEERAQAEEEVEKTAVTRDANGNVLEDGDTVTVVQDIKMSGSARIKQGTRATKLRILENPVNDHDIECTVDGMGRMYLKSFLVKK